MITTLVHAVLRFVAGAAVIVASAVVFLATVAAPAQADSPKPHPTYPAQTFTANQFIPEKIIRDKFRVVMPVTPKVTVHTAAPKVHKSEDTSYTTPVGTAQRYAANKLSASNFSCLVNLWNKESGWDTHAENPDSGAYGIPQSLPGDKMASVASDWRDNYKTQIDWGLGYIAQAYGSACAAWSHSVAVGWY